MKIKAIAAAASLGLLAPGLALAEFNYTSAEVNLVPDVEFDSTSVDGDGFAIAGSYEVHDSFFVSASYLDADLDLGIDAEQLAFGGGYFHTLNEDLDFVATLSFVDVEIGSGDTDGIALGGGIRTRLSNEIEVDAMLEYTDFDGGSETAATVKGRYYFSDDLSAQLGISVGGLIETLSIGIRGEF